MSDNELDIMVGYLVLYRLDKADAFDEIPIEANSQFDIGREHVRRSLGLNDQSISSHHLRFHCVMYGDEDTDDVPPLVYVRLLSSNSISIMQASPTAGTSTYLLTKGHPDVLLNHGDKLRLSPSVFVEFSATFEPTNPLEPIQRAETKSFSQHYSVTPRKLGAGGYASVYLAANSNSGRQLACKIVRLPECASSGKLQVAQRSTAAAQEFVADQTWQRKKCQGIRREFEILSRVDHPNVIRLEKAYYAPKHIYIFQELVTGGDLLSYVESKQVVAEPECAVIIYQLLNAVEYLHSQNIVHRDIKPENILMTSWREGARIVLTDFGQSRTLEDAKKDAQPVFRMQSLVGTHGWSAPEMHHQLKKDMQRRIGYSKAVDIWSVGCLAGMLFTNSFLFPKDNESKDSEHIAPSLDMEQCAAKFDLGFMDTRADWDHVSRKAKDFIRKCVMVDESERLTAKQALLHRWFTHHQYVADLQAAYGRAIADWKPRTPGSRGDLIEYLGAEKTGTNDPQGRYDAQLHADVKSRFFSAGLPPVPQFRSFEPSAHASKQRHTPLSPLTSDALPGASPIRPQTAGAGAVTQDGETLLSAAEGQTYFSIQDLAPPESFHPLTPGGMPSFSQTGWDLEIRDSIDPHMLDITGARVRV